MTKNIQSSNSALDARARSNARARLDKRQLNSPVPLETFEHERMGIAAKE